MSVMDNVEIQSILPHRYPFLLVDRIRELDPDRRIVGIKNVTINEPFFQGHFPGRPVMPGVLILEALAQVGGVLAFKSLGSVGRPVVYLTGIDGAKFRKPVVPGDILRLEVDVLKKRAPFWKMQGRAFVESELVCEAEVTAMVTDEQAGGTSSRGSVSAGGVALNSIAVDGEEVLSEHTSDRGGPSQSGARRRCGSGRLFRRR
jgi:3-hydroxyacyl-[acyl-carrier-protein] dehydratase